MDFAQQLDPQTLAQLMQAIQNYRPGETQAAIYGNDGLSYMPGMTQGVYGGEGSTPTYTSDGKFYVGKFDAAKGGDLGIYDSTGKFTGQTQHFAPDDWNFDTLAMAAAGAFGVGFAALAGGAGAGAGLSGMDLAADGGANALSGFELSSGMDLAADGAAGNALPGFDGAPTGDWGPGPEPYDPSTMPTETSVPTTPTGTPTSPTTTPTTPTTTPGTTPSIPKVPIPGVPGTGGGTGTGTGTGTGGFDLTSLLGLISGIAGMNNQEHASQAMIDYLRQRQEMNDKMYAPGSTEFNSMWDAMSRQDAAAGRNSQYGPRSVDLAARLAQLKMDANTKMTTGIGNFMANAMNQKANALGQVTSMLPGILQSAGGTNGLNLSQLTNWINTNFGGGSNNGTNVPGTPYQPGDTFNPANNPANPNLDSDWDVNGNVGDYYG